MSANHGTLSLHQQSLLNTDREAWIPLVVADVQDEKPDPWGVTLASRVHECVPSGWFDVYNDNKIHLRQQRRDTLAVTGWATFEWEGVMSHSPLGDTIENGPFRMSEKVVAADKDWQVTHDINAHNQEY